MFLNQISKTHYSQFYLLQQIQNAMQGLQNKICNFYQNYKTKVILFYLHINSLFIILFAITNQKCNARTSEQKLQFLQKLQNKVILFYLHIQQQLLVQLQYLLCTHLQVQVITKKANTQGQIQQILATCQLQNVFEIGNNFLQHIVT
eukprot:EC096624.1.p3 GENE.EC096624.1~~EC096624.1.p3  ORF type:complete len:147 (-),score=8.58 EC096624.1:104-544(-)